jgi:hypothetical protein
MRPSRPKKIFDCLADLSFVDVNVRTGVRRLQRSRDDRFWELCAIDPIFARYAWATDLFGIHLSLNSKTGASTGKNWKERARPEKNARRWRLWSRWSLLPE